MVPGERQVGVQQLGEPEPRRLPAFEDEANQVGAVEGELEHAPDMGPQQRQPDVDRAALFNEGFLFAGDPVGH